MKYLASVLTVLGTVAATIGTQGCWVLFVDEPKMPKHLIEK